MNNLSSVIKPEKENEAKGQQYNPNPFIVDVVSAVVTMIHTNSSLQK